MSELEKNNAYASIEGGSVAKTTVDAKSSASATTLTTTTTTSPEEEMEPEEEEEGLLASTMTPIHYFHGRRKKLPKKFPSQAQRRCRHHNNTVTSVPEWLMQRQEGGKRSLCLRRKVMRMNMNMSASSSSSSGGGAHPQQLASSIAWNRFRMANIILAVGPGTPATVMSGFAQHHHDDDNNNNRGNHGDFESSSSSSSSSDDDNDDDDDEVVVVEAAAAAAMQEEEGGLQQEEGQLSSSSSENENEDGQAAMQEEEEEEGKEKQPGPDDADMEMVDDHSNSIIIDDDDDDDGEGQSDPNNGDALEDDAQQEMETEEEGAEVVDQPEEVSNRGNWLRVVRGRGDNVNDDDNDDDEASDDDDGNDDDDDSEDDDFFLQHIRRQRRRRRQQQQQMYNRIAVPRVDETNALREAWLPDMRHGGCINTACWMDCPWRLALPSSYSGHASMAANPERHVVVESTDMPTQLATSGDDRIVKIWDLHRAMGTANPLPGGWDTFCPFADLPSREENDSDEEESPHSARRPRREWRAHYQKMPESKVAGGVVPLASLRTGHRGNIFHVTPVKDAPGQMLTSAADGFLRLSHLEASSTGSVSSVVIQPYVDDESDMLFVLHSGMAYSHHMLNRHAGLLCSDRGLHRFDLRLSPREQPRKSLIAELGSCKACAPWSPQQRDRRRQHGLDNSSKDDDYEFESNYVFAGGSSGYVGLYDLRMVPCADSSGSSNVAASRSSRIIERYKPRGLNDGGNVSVSGLDVSRDGRELLVSYESDQVYAFPILQGGGGGSAAGRTIEELDALSERFTSNAEDFQPDFAAYGGHLNRFTFLKNAKYAGPNDDYICTGSDGGHAWIYERSTGTVAALLSADSSTCNGVVPHPVLPFFVTYGIDSTAKLWRATPPVNPRADDSVSGRRRCALTAPYEMSPVTRTYDGIQILCRQFRQQPAILPDYIASSEEISASGQFSSPTRRGMVDYTSSPRIGNALRTLPYMLRQNRFECYRAMKDEDSIPIDSSLRALSHRVSLMRLQYQADRLGLRFDFQTPWAFREFDSFDLGNDDDDDEGHEEEQPTYPGHAARLEMIPVHPADLVPDSPSDWIQLDSRMSPDPFAIEANFNLQQYERIFLEQNVSLWKGIVDSAKMENARGAEAHEMKEDGKDDKESDDDDVPWLVERGKKLGDELAWPVGKRFNVNDESDDQLFGPAEREKSRALFSATALLLKEGGNVAMKEGHFQAAARRYDKAIQYCAVALMSYLEGTKALSHLTKGLGEFVNGMISSDYGRSKKPHRPVVWCPVLRILITTRLNMALLMLKPDFANPRRAADHAKEALRLLALFTVQEGKVMLIFNAEDKVIRDDEPVETFHEAKALQAKAYFRLGSAEFEAGNYAEAVESFELSIASSQKSDHLVARRLKEAKVKLKSKKKRDRHKFEFAFGQLGKDEES